MSKKGNKHVVEPGDAVSSPMACSSKIQLKTREILSKIKVLIQCSICRDDIFEPLRTPCDHYFCSSCITKHLESRAKEVNDKTGTKLAIQCPNCKGKITKRSLVPAPQLHELLLNILATNDNYRDLAGHSVLGADPVVFSARKRVPDPVDVEPSPPKKSKSTSKSITKSKTTIEKVIENGDEDDDEEAEKLNKKKKKKAEGDVLCVKRKLLTKKTDKNVYSFSGSEDDDGPVNKKSASGSCKKPKTKKSSVKQSKDYDSDAGSVKSLGKKNKSSKTDKASKKSKKASATAETSSKVVEKQKEKKDEEEEEEEPKPPSSPKVLPKPLRKVSKPKEGTPNMVPSTSASKVPSPKSKEHEKPPSVTSSTSSKSSSVRKPISVITESTPGHGRTKLPLISPMKRRDQPVDIDFDMSGPSRIEPTLQERLRETISKVSSSTPILAMSQRPALRNTMSPVTNGVALVMSDDDDTIEATQKSKNVTQEKSSNIDELLKEVEKKSIDEADSEGDDFQPIMEAPNRSYRRSSVASSDHSATRKSDVRFNNLLKKSTSIQPQPTSTITQSVQTDKREEDEKGQGDEDKLYSRLRKLFEALCTQHGVEGTINVEGFGRFEMKLTKGRDSMGSPDKKNDTDEHCLSQVISYTREKRVQTDEVVFKEFVAVQSSSCQVTVDNCCKESQTEVEVQKQVDSKGIQTSGEVKVIDVIDIPSQSTQGTQTETIDHVSVGREEGKRKINTGVGSQLVNSNSVKNNSLNSTSLNSTVNAGNNTTRPLDSRLDDDEDLGSDFSQSILDLLDEEEEKRKKKNEHGEVISITETPPRILKRLSLNNTTLSTGEQTTMESTRRSLASSFVNDTVLESDPDD